MNTNIVFKTRFAFSPYFRYGFSSFSTAICIFSRFFDYFWFFSFPPQKSANYLSRVRPAVTSRRRQEACCKSPPLYSELANVMGRGWWRGLRRRPCLTNRIQREFLFNDAIQSQKACCHFAPPSHAQNFPKKSPFFSNLLKLGVL
jgi:hypothetical protein